MRAVWRKFKQWLISQANRSSAIAQAKRAQEKRIPLTLWLPNNTFVSPFRKPIESFLFSLSETDRNKLNYTIRSNTDKGLGMRLFNARVIHDTGVMQAG